MANSHLQRRRDLAVELSRVAGVNSNCRHNSSVGDCHTWVVSAIRVHTYDETQQFSRVSDV